MKAQAEQAVVREEWASGERYSLLPFYFQRFPGRGRRLLRSALRSHRIGLDQLGVRMVADASSLRETLNPEELGGDARMMLVDSAGKALLGEGVVSEFPHAVLDAASANLAAEGSVDLRTREVDGVLLASPFKTIDTIIRAIPIVRYILKGRLVAVPFGIKGPVGDPSVTVMPPAEVGAGLLGVVERTLKLPVRLIKPILPKEKDRGKPAPAPLP